MNDRLKYRVWDKENEIWLENGDCSLSMDGELTVLGIDAYGETMFCDSKNYLIEQCTGLRDKNGKLIYENDIVKGKATIGEGGFEYLGCIKWYYQSELIGWYIEDKDGGAWELKQAHAKISADNITGEVIGNIHENIDLLGKE